MIHNGHEHILEKVDLEKMYTRQLINMIHHSDETTHCNKKDGLVEYMWDGEDSWWFNEQELRDILKTRPHIPSKKEAHELRKAIIAQNKRKTKRNF